MSPRWRMLPKLLLPPLMLAALYFLSGATQNSQRFGELYVWLLLANGLAVLLLSLLIASNLWRLLRQYRAREPGAKLTARWVLAFSLLAGIPVALVYGFSVQLLRQGIDSWFDVRVEQALADALALSQSALDLRMRELLKDTQTIADELTTASAELAVYTLNDWRSRSDAAELTLLTDGGRILAYSSADPSLIVPDRPNEQILLQLRQEPSYVGLDTVRDAGLHVRAVATVPGALPGETRRLLQALYPITGRLSAQADSVQNAYARYKELAFLRTPLKQSFILSLSLVLLLSLLSAVWAALWAARRLMSPIRRLAQGTRAVIEGRYGETLPAAGRDELGFLVASFNDMTRKLRESRAATEASQREVEAQRAYLATVLGSLSSGVITLDHALTLHTANAAAAHILHAPLDAYTGHALTQIGESLPHLAAFTTAIAPRVHASQAEWQQEATLFGPAGRQVLICRGARLAHAAHTGGETVVVIDDITALVQAQRDAAWGDVARRLAHEIKNPLTPIQLSAERLRHRLLAKLTEQEAQLLDSATHTIVQQVEAMKEMVNAFSEYARAPQLRLMNLDLNRLLLELADLYRGYEGLTILLRLDRELPLLHGDPGRLRQLAHNLIKNAVEAMAGRPDARLVITTRAVDESGTPAVEWLFEDNGPGFPEPMRSQLFEPYVTTKPRGTGLGLPIVKKIVEEHGGMITADNGIEAGACVVIRLPRLANEPPLTAPPGRSDFTERVPS